MTDALPDPDPDRLGSHDPSFDVQLFGLATAVYAERDGKILMLKRAGGAMTGQRFLPGGALDRDELPEDGARRELVEESGLDIVGEVVLSHEHTDARWVDPVEQRAELSDELVEALSAGDARIGALVRGIRTDLDRYLRRVGRA